MMSDTIDLPTWERKESFDWFRQYEDPFSNVTINLDVTALWDWCHDYGWSVHHAMLYAVVHTANHYAPMRWRRRGGDVVELDHIDIGCSVRMDEDGTFGFGYYSYDPKEGLRGFMPRALEETRRVAAGHKLDPQDHRDDLIYSTSLPWLNFTSIKHARKAGQHSIPKIAFGRIHDVGERMMMPFNLEVDHALMDGRHMGEFTSLLQCLMDYPEVL